MKLLRRWEDRGVHCTALSAQARLEYRLEYSDLVREHQFYDKLHEHLALNVSIQM